MSRKENMSSKNPNTTIKKTKKKSLSSLLKSTGFLLPTTDEEIEQSESLLGATPIILPESVSNPSIIWDKIKRDFIAEKPKAKVIELKKNDYFKKLVLAAEVTDQLHSEPTFGHVKFVKVLYLCQEACDMELSTNYSKHAAGPFDPKYMYTAIAEFKRRGWFNEGKRNNSYGFNFTRGENADEFKGYYPKYFKNQIVSISHIIELLRKKKTSFCEIVATLYFLWKESILNKNDIDDDTLITRFYSWGEEKHKFTISEIKDALVWMKTEQVFPRV